ncbi:unnamed protein product [Mycena citricolor]|uniref:cyclin-dependent kinase n=1 Tax=Mycena citricolor TaxID=2018698 RepID=A0AAD2HIS8_9AGAR|nr:unnamed protein product [Mycena citricolor]
MERDEESLKDGQYHLIEDGPYSSVSRIWTTLEGQRDTPQWIVAKSATNRKSLAKEPHDIVKELRVLSSLNHENIVPVLSSFSDATARILTIYLPYIPHSLEKLLSSPSFSPYSLPRAGLPAVLNPAQESEMLVLAKSVAAQTLQALKYLHALGISHRDLKPANILLTHEAHVVLIDFGVARDAVGDCSDDMWPEAPDGLYFEVCTGPYRAPELLFGVRSYEPACVDLWSFGTILAEMFTTLRLDSESYSYDNGEAVPSAQPDDQPFVVPGSVRVGQPETAWARDPLFNGYRGELALIWSIFKMRGTPTDETWPGFTQLLGSSSVDFKVVPAVDLKTMLSNRPANADQLLHLLDMFLVYSPAQRMSAAEALQHRWFSEQPCANNDLGDVLTRLLV